MAVRSLPKFQRPFKFQHPNWQVFQTYLHKSLVQKFHMKMILVIVSLLVLFFGLMIEGGILDYKSLHNHKDMDHLSYELLFLLLHE